MGYYTHHKLTVIPEDARASVEKAAARIVGCEPFEDTVKWYECHGDMINVSVEIPAIIIVDGDGEEAGDVWRAVFCNGRKVWEWKADCTRPDVPADIMKALLPEVASRRSVEEEDARQQEIKMLRDRLVSLGASE